MLKHSYSLLQTVLQTVQTSIQQQQQQQQGKNVQRSWTNPWDYSKEPRGCLCQDVENHWQSVGDCHMHSNDEEGPCQAKRRERWDGVCGLPRELWPPQSLPHPFLSWWFAFQVGQPTISICHGAAADLMRTCIHSKMDFASSFCNADATGRPRQLQRGKPIKCCSVLPCHRT